MPNDTVKLLKACNAGCKTATNCMEQVRPHIRDEAFGDVLEDYDERHAAFGEEFERLLKEEGSAERDPKPAVRKMARLGTGMHLMLDDSTGGIAEMLMNGTYRGIKSVSEYCNRYRAASADATRLAHRLIETEECFMKELRPYL